MAHPQPPKERKNSHTKKKHFGNPKVLKVHDDPTQKDPSLSCTTLILSLIIETYCFV